MEIVLGDLVFQDDWDYNPQDDLPGKPLEPGLVIGAKREELTEIYRRRVWAEKYVEDCFRDTEIPRSRCVGYRQTRVMTYIHK